MSATDLYQLFICFLIVGWAVDRSVLLSVVTRQRATIEVLQDSLSVAQREVKSLRDKANGLTNCIKLAEFNLDAGREPENIFKLGKEK